MERGEGGGDRERMGEETAEGMPPKNPLNWFGVLVPQSLRQSQENFIQGENKSHWEEYSYAVSHCWLAIIPPLLPPPSHLLFHPPPIPSFLTSPLPSPLSSLHELHSGYIVWRDCYTAGQTRVSESSVSHSLAQKTADQVETIIL